MSIRYTLVLIFFMLFASCNNRGKLFESIPSSITGITFQNTITESEDLNILEYLYFYNGGSVAIGDINSDGLPDIYFSGNQVKNKLYLNKGNLEFEDITESAGVEGKSDWSTTAVMGDINGDGLLDIYVCAVVGIRGLRGHNELFINNGDNTFTESAVKYGLDFESYSSTAAFLDYDKDGDLDIFLLNHAMHRRESFGPSILRNKRTYETGDKLLRNEGNKFVDVSEEAGIYGGINGYGLSVAVADFNLDGYPDLFVGNDFHEDDYYYLNNGDGTYTECLKNYFGHTSRFSMGCDVSDINNDGLTDIISLDMLPENEKVLKSSDGDEGMDILRLRTRQYGYYYQFSRNMLQINHGKNGYSETALISGVAATDWSWSPLFADYNQDGKQDLYISNGIPKRPNDLDYIQFVSSQQIKEKIDATNLVDQQALELMPPGLLRNYIFKGSGDMHFEDKSDSWIPDEKLYSTSTALADLDNDGDIDLVTNNINSEASIYINSTNENAGYLKLNIEYKAPNKYGIGTKVYSYTGGQEQYKELYTVRGFQSSSEPFIHFGYGSVEKVDSLRVVWPDNTTQLMKDISINQTITLSPENTHPFSYKILEPAKNLIFESTDNNLGIDFVHKEDRYIDFDRQKIIPYRVSDRGPATALGDINNDGREDIFFGGSKYFLPAFFIKTDSSFKRVRIPEIEKDSIKEDVDAIIADFNNDGRSDVLLGSGGADFYNKMKPLLDSYYIGSDSTYSAGHLPDYFENASVIAEADYDNDGDIDVFVGAQSVSNDFGNIPNSYLLDNNNGEFSIAENLPLQKVGMVTDAIWSDYNNDGELDLIVVGEWMSPTFFKNHAGSLTKDKVLEGNNKGLWQSIVPFDIDGDGDTDYILGNWGLNSKFKASSKYPLMMYYNDFDKNGSTETIIALEKNGKYYSLEGLDGLADQIPDLKVKYTKYKDFAGKTVKEIFDGDAIKNAKVLKVENLSSGYMKNENGMFIFYPLPSLLQLAPITSFCVYDFDNDGKEEVLAGGNYFGVKPLYGRFDGFSGALIKSEEEVLPGYEIGLELNNKSVRAMNVISVNQQNYLLVTINNSKTQVYKLLK